MRAEVSLVFFIPLLNFSHCERTLTWQTTILMCLKLGYFLITTVSAHMPKTVFIWKANMCLFCFGYEALSSFLLDLFSVTPDCLAYAPKFAGKE